MKIENYLKQAGKVNLVVDKHERLLNIFKKVKSDLNFLIITPLLGGFCGLIVENKLGTHWFADLTFWSIVLVSICALCLNIPKRKELKKIRLELSELFNEYKKERDLLFSMFDKIDKEELYYFIDENYTKLNKEEQNYLDNLSGYIGGEESKKEQLLNNLKLSKLGVTIEND